MATKKRIPEDCMPRCDTCAFMQAVPRADAGYCRRFPPAVIHSDEGSCSAYPVVKPADWCGEFVRKVN